MRKRIAPTAQQAVPPSDEWLDVDQLAQLEITSEDAAFPIEGALATSSEETTPWRAAEPGAQSIRLIFDQPRRLRRIWLRFLEPLQQRTQEFVLRWSADGQSFREIVRQQWTFSPQGAVSEVEDYRIDIVGVVALELKIVPDIGGGPALASLAQMRLV